MMSVRVLDAVPSVSARAVFLSLRRAERLIRGAIALTLVYSTAACDILSHIEICFSDFLFFPSISPALTLWLFFINSLLKVYHPMVPIMATD